MKANSKSKADPKDEGGAANPKKKMLGLIGGVAVVVALGGAGGFYWSTMGANGAGKEHKSEKAEPPEYIALDSFTVNLQPENGDQYLQVQFTLQVANAETAELIKANMAKARSRVLLLLSGKHASEINTVEGKQVLAKEIVDTLKQPFTANAEPQKISDVLFTAFIIQ